MFVVLSDSLLMTHREGPTFPFALGPTNYLGGPDSTHTTTVTTHTLFHIIDITAMAVVDDQLLLKQYKVNPVLYQMY